MILSSFKYFEEIFCTAFNESRKKTVLLYLTSETKNIYCNILHEQILQNCMPTLTK